MNESCRMAAHHRDAIAAPLPGETCFNGRDRTARLWHFEWKSEDVAKRAERYKEDEDLTAMPAKKLKEFLDTHQVKCVAIRHSAAYTAQESRRLPISGGRNWPRR